MQLTLFKDITNLKFNRYFISGIITVFFCCGLILIFPLAIIRSILFFFILFLIVYYLSHNLSVKYSDYRLLYLFLLSFLLRVLVAYLTSTIFPLDKNYISDPIMYDMQMENIAKSYFTFSIPYIRMNSLNVLTYSYFGSFFYFIFGSSMIIMKILNSFIGILLIINIYRITYIISTKRSAYLAALLTAFWPSIIFRSSQNFRDPLIVLCISQIVYLFVAGVFYKRKINFLLLIIPLTTTFLLRNYIGIIISLLLFIIISIQFLKLRNYLKPIGIITTFIILGILIYILYQHLPRYIPLLDKIRTYRATGGSAYLVDNHFENFYDLLNFLPKGIFYFLFSPFTIMTENLLQFFSSIENFFFYIIFITSILGIFQMLRDGKRKLIYFPILLVIFIIIIYSIIEANMGTAYRHKMQILPLIFIFASYYLSNINIKMKG